MEKSRPEILSGEEPEKLSADLMSSDWAEKLKENPVDLTEEKPEFTVEELKEKYPGKAAVIDVYIKDIEKSDRWNGNVLCMGDILSIDHHAPAKEFRKNISSTNLAIDWVRSKGVLGGDYRVVINHMDCDSVLAALIMRGILLPEERFGQAAIAADHTGAVNEIADLLQAIEDERNLEFSARNLQLLLVKKSLEPRAQELLEKRYADRAKAAEVVKNGDVHVLGGVSFVRLDKKIDSGFFPALIPDAQVILAFSPHEKDIGNSEVKIRLGMSAPPGLALYKLKIGDFDPTFGSRWNAGSNDRSLGVSVGIEEYAKLLNEKLQEYMESKKE